MQSLLPENAPAADRLQAEIAQLRGDYDREEARLHRKYLKKARLIIERSLPSHAASISDYLAAALHTETDCAGDEEQELPVPVRVKAAEEVEAEAEAQIVAPERVFASLRDVEQRFLKVRAECVGDDSMLSDGSFNQLLERLRAEHEEVSEEADALYERQKGALEAHYREQIAALREESLGGSSSGSADLQTAEDFIFKRMQEYLREHREKLGALRLAFQKASEHVQETYVAVLRQVTVGSMQEEHKQEQEREVEQDSRERERVPSRHAEGVLQTRDQNEPAETRCQSLKEKYLRYAQQKEQQQQQTGGGMVARAPLSAKAWAWGSGKDGRCGSGSEVSEGIPAALSVGLRFSHISCGYHHTAAVTSQGRVFTWGRGTFGQLGLGGTANALKPTPVESLEGIVAVECGWQHTLALQDNGQVFSWGYGEDGQLGHGDGFDCVSPRLVRGLAGIKRIACGHSHSGALSHRGQLYLWGCNPDQRLMLHSCENSLQ